MSRRIDARELLAALGGVLVLISLFLEWYAADGARAGGNGLTGWETFEALDLVLAALALAVIATGARALGTVGGLGPRALLPLGAGLTIIVVIQLASPPPVAWGTDVSTGGWLALAGSLVVLAAGLLRAAKIDVTVNVAAREARQRVSAVDKRPAATAAPAETPERRSLLDEPDPQATQPFKPVDG